MQAAIKLIESEAGTSFDPEIVKKFRILFDNGELKAIAKRITEDSLQ